MKVCDYVYDRVYHTAAVEFRNCSDLIIGIGKRKNRRYIKFKDVMDYLVFYRVFCYSQYEHKRMLLYGYNSEPYMVLYDPDTEAVGVSV